MAENPENCLPCRLNVGAGIALTICEFLVKENLSKMKLNCKELQEKVEQGKITQSALVELMIENSTDADIAEDLKEIKRMMLGPDAEKTE